MGQRDKPFGLLIFTPDTIIAADQEVAIGGEGMTVRIPLDAFIAKTNWPVILPLVQAYQDEQDRIRREQHERP
jgi:hypothetical protein